MNDPRPGFERADLHNHTTASDGLLTPAELIEYAAKKGLKAVAITDHDTTDGIQAAIETGVRKGIEVIPGIELNTQLDRHEIHILGYFLRVEEPWLQELLFTIRDSRDHRAERMVQKLSALFQLQIQYEEVLEEAKGGAVARPHIARVMIRKGYVKDIPEAFERYLGTDSPAYVDRFRLTPKEGISLIRRAGGVPVLAHPGLLPDPTILERVLKDGIEGIEAYHSKHTQDESIEYAKFTIKNGLIVTGGSDCHGEIYNGLPIIGDISVGLEVVEALRDRSAQNREYE